MFPYVHLHTHTCEQESVWLEMMSGNTHIRAAGLLKLPVSHEVPKDFATRPALLFGSRSTQQLWHKLRIDRSQYSDHQALKP